MRNLLFSLLLISASAEAAVYKCKMPNGKLLYQSLPCPSDSISSEESKIKQIQEKNPRLHEKVNPDDWKKSTQLNHPIYNDPSDNSVRQVKEHLEITLKDPESVRYAYWSDVLTHKDRYLVRCRFRAKNSYGGYVISDKVFELDKYGIVTRYRDYSPLESSIPSHLEKKFLWSN